MIEEAIDSDKDRIVFNTEKWEGGVRPRILTDIHGNYLSINMEGNEHLYDSLLAFLEDSGYIITKVDKENKIIEARSK